MKRFYYITFFLLITILCISFSQSESEPIQKVTNNYIQRFNETKKALLKLIESIQSKSSENEIQNAYLELRKSFKKWEYLVATKDPVFIKEVINPSPLPKLEENSFGANIISPRGLQVLDDLVFSQKIQEAEALEQAKYLNKMLSEFTPMKLYDRDVIEGIRTELIRVFTLGLTGFDTPASSNGIQDALSAYEAMYSDMQFYLPAIHLKDSALSKRINNSFIKSINYLKANSDFGSFNRLKFLKECINPLYKEMLHAHRVLNIELPHEVYLAPRPINYEAENIFDNNLINKNYYAPVPSKFINEKTIELGKVLFYDPILSSGIDRSCASCHSPEKAFTDQLPKSVATGKNGFLKRNSPTLINSVYAERLFHDMRARTFIDQMEHVLSTKEEFNSDMIQLLEKLKLSKEYISLFYETFQDKQEAIRPVYIQMALSVFVSSLSGFNSEFDKYVRGEISSIKPDVMNGFNLFMGKAVCGTCHFAPVFNGTVPPDYKDTESEVLGVPENPHVKKPLIDNDEGRGNALLKESVYFNKYAFKTPTVRNVALTYPYMHNGCYKTLEDVMDFYNKGGGKGIGIVLEHQTLPFDELKLTKKEINDIVAFMKALTDTSGLTSKPSKLPFFDSKPEWNKRKVGGEY